MKLNSRKYLFTALFCCLSAIAFALLNLKSTAFVDMTIGGISFVFYLVTEE